MRSKLWYGMGRAIRRSCHGAMTVWTAISYLMEFLERSKAWKVVCQVFRLDKTGSALIRAHVAEHTLLASRRQNLLVGRSGQCFCYRCWKEARNRRLYEQDQSELTSMRSPWHFMHVRCARGQRAFQRHSGPAMPVNNRQARQGLPVTLPLKQG